jgi:uncharacterized protein
MRITPGRALHAVAAAHGLWSTRAYGRELAGIAHAGVVDTVGDGIFRREHSRDARAAAFWFLAPTPLIAVLGTLLDSTSDRRAARAAGATLLGVGAAGVTIMPRSGFWLLMPIGARLLWQRNPEGDAAAVVSRFLDRQRAMYAGGDAAPVEAMLADDIVWHVPGTSAIAGDHRGPAAVMRYFTLRRELAGGRMEIVPLGELHGDDVVVHLADGRAMLGGELAHWRTAGVYRVADGRVAEAWLVPLELDAFDAAWRRAN